MRAALRSGEEKIPEGVEDDQEFLSETFGVQNRT